MASDRTHGEDRARAERASLVDESKATDGTLAFEPFDPVSTIRQARASLRRLQAVHPRGVAAQRLEEWEQLLNGPTDELLEVITSRSDRGNELRQNSPFAGVLTERERSRILESFRRVHPAEA